MMISRLGNFLLSGVFVTSVEVWKGGETVSRSTTSAIYQLSFLPSGGLGGGVLDTFKAVFSRRARAWKWRRRGREKVFQMP